MQNSFVDLLIVIPVYRDDRALRRLLDELQPLVARFMRDKAGHTLRCVVADGANSATTRTCVSGDVAYLPCARGRGLQIHAALAAHPSHWVWILHADAVVGRELLDYIWHRTMAVERGWGRFDVALPGLAVIAHMMNWRSRLTRICTGDQGMFFATELLAQCGGFPQLPLMEDIALSRSLKRSFGYFVAPRLVIHSSPRRWREHGVVRTVFFMWWLRLRYFLGVPAEHLYQLYYPDSVESP